MNVTNQTALVLGATGGIGSEVAQQLKSAGWKINALKRGSVKPESNNITWFLGDALNKSDVEAASQGCSVIIHAVNPAGYKNWGELVLPMIDNTIEAAKKLGACIVLPGTVYNYGPNEFLQIDEDSPQNPRTEKGKIREELESRLQIFAEQGGQVIIVRAGDFFGPTAANSWFSQGLIKPNKPIKNIRNPSSKNVGHQWTYLPDMAATMVTLIEIRNSLEPFSRFHMKGFWDEDGTQMAKAIAHAVERNTGRIPKISSFPWWLMHVIAPFNETLKEMLKMRYLWKNPVRMNNHRLVAQLGKEISTPIDQAVENTLRALNCLQ